jgi:hypothetical protein
MWSYNKTNYILFFIGLTFIIIGYIIMALGSVNSFQSIDLAPTLLFVGYIIIIPFSLYYRKKSEIDNLRDRSSVG